MSGSMKATEMSTITISRDSGGSYASRLSHLLTAAIPMGIALLRSACRAPCKFAPGQPNIAWVLRVTVQSGPTTAGGSGRLFWVGAIEDRGRLVSVSGRAYGVGPAWALSPGLSIETD